MVFPSKKKVVTNGVELHILWITFEKLKVSYQILIVCEVFKIKKKKEYCLAKMLDDFPEAAVNKDFAKRLAIDRWHS